MKTPNINVLLHTVTRDAPEHAKARDWLENAYAEPAGVGFAWVALLGFLRIATRRGIFAQPLTIESALALMDEWLSHTRARLLPPIDRHPALLARLLLGEGRGGNLVTDAHLAAVAIEHGATLGTFDHDFERFAGLRVDYLGRPTVHES